MAPETNAVIVVLPDSVQRREQVFCPPILFSALSRSFVRSAGKLQNFLITGRNYRSWSRSDKRRYLNEVSRGLTLRYDRVGADALHSLRKVGSGGGRLEVGFDVGLRCRLLQARSTGHGFVPGPRGARQLVLGGRRGKVVVVVMVVAVGCQQVARGRGREGERERRGGLTPLSVDQVHLDDHDIDDFKVSTRTNFLGFDIETFEGALKMKCVTGVCVCVRLRVCVCGRMSGFCHHAGQLDQLASGPAVSWSPAWAKS